VTEQVKRNGGKGQPIEDAAVTADVSGGGRDTHVFWVQGISCLDCAADFERAVASLPGVLSASLNTTNGKLTVVGQVDLEELRRLGRAEDYVITPERRQSPREGGKAGRAELWRAAVSATLLALAILLEQFVPALAWTTAGASPAAGRIAGALMLGAIVVGGWSNARRAFFALQRLNFNMSVLMTTAIIGALAIGEWREAAVVAVLFAVSDWLEAWTYGRARRSIRELLEAAPKRARVKRAGGEVELPVEDLVIGDVVVIRPGEKIPVDGVVIWGESAVDEASITGEAIPKEKGAGAEVFAGTLNIYGALEVQVTKPAQETTIAKIIQLVEEAEGRRAKSHAFVDRFAQVYTPIVIGLAALIAAVPPLLFSQPWQPWIYRGLALLVVACPCALVVATPVSIISAISNAARRGILVKGGVYLEELAQLQAVAFDKTGTLTKGKPAVTDVVPLADWPEDKLLQAAASLEALSEHPLAAAIVRASRERGLAALPVERFEAWPGRGVKGAVTFAAGGNGTDRNAEATTLYAGNGRLFEELGLLDDAAAACLGRLHDEGKTTVLIGTSDRILGVIAVADELRPDAPNAVAALKRSGVAKTVMLTGDNPRAAKATAARAGVDEVAAELLPQDKVRAVEALKAAYGRVAMVGDGVNDAPALAAATVGVAMGGAGSDTALETADVVLMSDDLRKLPFAVGLSRATLRVIKQNIYFAVGLKLAAVLAVFPGWLTLWLAILADMGATVLVTLNGMRLLAYGGLGPARRGRAGGSHDAHGLHGHDHDDDHGHGRGHGHGHGHDHQHGHDHAHPHRRVQAEG